MVHASHDPEQESSAGRRRIFPLSLRTSLVLVVLLPIAAMVGFASTTAAGQWSSRSEAVNARATTVELDSLMQARAAVTDGIRGHGGHRLRRSPSRHYCQARRAPRHQLRGRHQRRPPRGRPPADTAHDSVARSRLRRAAVAAERRSKGGVGVRGSAEFLRGNSLRTSTPCGSAASARCRSRPTRRRLNPSGKASLLSGPPSQPSPQAFSRRPWHKPC